MGFKKQNCEESITAEPAEQPQESTGSKTLLAFIVLFILLHLGFDGGTSLPEILGGILASGLLLLPALIFCLIASSIKKKSPWNYLWLGIYFTSIPLALLSVIGNYCSG